MVDAEQVRELKCPNPLCYEGWVPYGRNESKGAPPIVCRHPECPYRDKDQSIGIPRTLEDKMNSPTQSPNYQGPGRYRHYKGGIYEVVGVALRENSIDKGGAVSPMDSDGEQFVIYKPLTPGSLLERRAEDFWARELSDFNAMVAREHGSIPRFTRESNHDHCEETEDSRWEEDMAAGFVHGMSDPEEGDR